MLLVENERGTIRVIKKIHFISGLTGTSTRSCNESCNVCVKIISSLIEAKKLIPLVLKFTNRIILTQQQSWESTYFSWRRACKEVKSAIHLSCTRFPCRHPQAKHSFLAWHAHLRTVNENSILKDERKKSRYGGIVPGNFESIFPLISSLRFMCKKKSVSKRLVRQINGYFRWIASFEFQRLQT